MGAWAGYRKVFLLSFLGVAFGYLFLHPYSMVVYGLYGRPKADDEGTALGRILHDVPSSFGWDMLPMGLPFALLGAVAGMAFGFWLEARARRHEMEKRLLAVETLRHLMVTLAHHLLNAVQGIGGFASRAIKREHDEDKKRTLENIRNQAVKIEAVVKSLHSLEAISTERYTESSETLMIDIRKELQAKLEALGGKIDQPPS